MLKGIHVYEKKTWGASYLCFIECKYLKDLEIDNNQLFCNNFVDMVVLDVSNPLQPNILHRQEYHFNKFSKYVQHWNFPYEEAKGIIVSYQNHELSGTVTNEKPNLDFSEYDLKYGNLTSKEIPANWMTGKPENNRPFIGIIKIDTDEIYTYGTYNSWAICTYRSGVFNVREVDLWSTSLGKYSVPYYYSDAHPFKVLYKEENIYILGKGFYEQSGYADCVFPNDQYPLSFHLYFPDFNPLDITYLSEWRAFIVLSGQSIWGAFKYDDPVMGTMERYKDFQIDTRAKSIFQADNKSITLGDDLSVYLPINDNLKLVKKYPIAGNCYLKEENVLTIANNQGLFFYDISNVENIQLIP